MRFQRRYFLRTATAAAACMAGRGLLAAESPPASASSYERASTDWLAKCRFGIGIHWTAQTVPRSGPPKPFQNAVADFDLQGFLAAVDHAGPIMCCSPRPMPCRCCPPRIRCSTSSCRDGPASGT